MRTTCKPTSSERETPVKSIKHRFEMSTGAKPYTGREKRNKFVISRNCPGVSPEFWPITQASRCKAVVVELKRSSCKLLMWTGSRRGPVRTACACVRTLKMLCTTYAYIRTGTPHSVCHYLSSSQARESIQTAMIRLQNLARMSMHLWGWEESICCVYRRRYRCTLQRALYLPTHTIWRAPLRTHFIVSISWIFGSLNFLYYPTKEPPKTTSHSQQ